MKIKLPKRKKKGHGKLLKGMHYKWNNGYYVRCYQLSRAGNNNSQIAHALGIGPETVKRWIRENEYLKEAIAAGKSSDGKGGQTFPEYVYERLTKRMRKYWDYLKEWEDEPNGVRKIEKLLRQKGTRIRQQLFLHALIASSFNMSEACRMVNISKPTFDQWCFQDPDFAGLIDEMQWHKGNFFEAAFVKLVRSGDSAATIYAQKTFNKGRGYSDKQEINVSHTHAHAVIGLEDLDLPLDVRKIILEAYRKRKEALALPAPSNETIIEAADAKRMVEANLVEASNGNG